MELEGENGIFMKIARKEAPAYVVYEDDETMAFLSIQPSTEGHTLVIPKRPARNIFDVDEETFLAVMKTVHHIAPAVRDAVGAKGVNINSNHEPEAGQTVFHFHVHIIPRFDTKEFMPWAHAAIDHGTAEEVAKSIREKLNG